MDLFNATFYEKIFQQLTKYIVSQKWKLSPSTTTSHIHYYFSGEQMDIIKKT